jgi:hypothetical protein
MTLLVLTGTAAPVPAPGPGPIGIWTPAGHFGHGRAGRYGDSLTGKIDRPNAGQFKVLTPA